jgi:hemerythrin-like domain-containing protein
MLPSEVRRRVLTDHEALRARLEEIEDLVVVVEEGGAERELSLRMRAVEFLDALERHMQWEERHLVPVLRDSDAWGPERVERFHHEHREQREVLRHILAILGDRDRPATLVARGIRDFAVLMRADMEDEESVFLDPRVVRDDVVAIDVETG